MLIAPPAPAFSTPRLPLAPENVLTLYKLTLLNSSVSPDTKPISGAPYTLVTFTKLPTSMRQKNISPNTGT